MSINVRVSSTMAQSAMAEEVALRGDVASDRVRVARALRSVAIRVEDGEMDDVLVIEGASGGALAVAEDHANDAEPLPRGLALGRVVMYRSRWRPYSLPAIVTATAKTLDPVGVGRLDVPALSSPRHVHLHVMTPGAQGCYVEHDVPFFDGRGLPVTTRPGAEPDRLEPRMGTWYWPERA